ncbi:MAG: long-chain-fatty-acid--CoA ligase [Syntrophothermus sp.]
MLLSETLENAADRHPSKEAVIFQDEVLTYQKLDEKVTRLANGLIGLGAGPGKRVALFLPNSADFLVCYFAVMKTGGTMVPMNPLFKGPEIQYILNDCQAILLITNAHFLKTVLEVQKEIPALQKIIVIGEADGTGLVNYHELIQSSSPNRRKLEITEESVASCLYTSGTTGFPKGAMLTHHNLTFDAAATAKALRVGDGERYMCVLPMFHSFAEIVCMVMPILTAATIVIVERFMPDTVLKVIQDWKVSVFSGVPSMYTALLNHTKDPGAFDLSSLRLCLSGGAAMPVEIMKRFEEFFKVVILEGYGPTEASPVTSVNPIDGPRKAGSVGLPLPGVEVKIFDDQDREVPTGELGEVVIRGENVMKGYLNKPEASVETLRHGWLHTGDLGKVDQDGYIYLVDRIKDMIIVGGLNVYPREVEEVIYQHPKVAEAAVVGVPDELRGEMVKAFVASKPGQTIEPKEIIHLCKERLANYKCPREVEIMESLPKNAAGKILKRVLKEREQKRH